MLAACSTPHSTRGGPTPGGGKADGYDTDASTDPVIDAPAPPPPDAFVPIPDAFAPIPVGLSGSCTVTTTVFTNNQGAAEVTSESIAVDFVVDQFAADGSVSGHAHLASMYGLPAGLWRGWCHLAHQDGQPLDSACVTGPFDLATSQLGFGGGWVTFHTDSGTYTVGLLATLEIGRDSATDPNWTKVSYSCTLR
jgi:hypothetical protein